MSTCRERWASSGIAASSIRRSTASGLAALYLVCAAWVGVASAAWAGVVALSLVNQVVLFGVAVILPLSIGGRLWWWSAAASGVLISYLVPTGSVVAGVAVVPFVAASAATVLTEVAEARRLGHPFRWRLADAAGGLAGVYAVVAAGALVQSRLGIAPFDLYEPLVELTAVHYIFAGSAALSLAGAALNGAARMGRRVASGAVALTAAAPPVVAAGFVTGNSAPQIGGAVLMALGVWLTAAVQLCTAAARLRSSIVGGAEKLSTGLLALSGLAAWVPMALAVAWAAGEHWRVPALSIQDMARTHGLANAFAFCFSGLLARRLGSGPAAALRAST